MQPAAQSQRSKCVFSPPCHSAAHVASRVAGGRLAGCWVALREVPLTDMTACLIGEGRSARLVDRLEVWHPTDRSVSHLLIALAMNRRFDGTGMP
jgi:hypothetical protein